MNLNPSSLFDFLMSNPSEQDCINYLEEVIWNGKVVSPFDPASKVYKCKNNRYKCENTNRYFTIKSITVFRKSRLSLKKWLFAVFLFSSQRISSCQLAKHINVNQRSAWYMGHRLRKSFETIFKSMLGGEVEIDETFIGGKNKNRHWDKKVPRSQGRNCKDKIPILGMRKRGGNVICQKVSNTQQKTLEPIIEANVEKGSTIYSDEWYRHSNLSENFNHQWVNHSAKQYAKGKVSVNSIESFWTFPKRGIYGTYHWISRKHAQKYMNEFAFRFNTRKYSEKERFDLVLASTAGKRLTYRELTNPSL